MSYRAIGRGGDPHCLGRCRAAGGAADGTGPHSFTGELNGLESLVSAQARPGTRVLRLSCPNFHWVLQTEADIAELVKRAFILRRMGLIQHGHGGAILLLALGPYAFPPLGHCGTVHTRAVQAAVGHLTCPRRSGPPIM